MIVVFPFSVIDQQLALKNAKWWNELGGCKGHEVLLMYDKRCDPSLVTAIKAEMSMAFDKVHPLECPAEIDGWPDGANYFFRLAVTRLETKPNTPFFLWMEPDAIPLKSGWIDALEKEYRAGRKPFMGDRVEVEDIPLHMSGIGFYPLPLHRYSGEAYRASEIAWDMAGKDQIIPQAHFTRLIEHAWKHPSFTMENELETQIRPEALVFHSSKDGSLIDLLQSKRGGKQPAVPAPSSSTAHRKEREEPRSPSPFPTCDIFIRTYEADYPWLQYCLQSIDKFCSGFRKIMVVSPTNPPPWMIGYKGVVPIEWKIMPDESDDGYLAQQIAKLYADVILDYQPDYILHVDSDVIFYSPCTPETFMRDGRVHWLFTPYSEIQTPWQPITEAFMGEAVHYEYMRRFPLMIPRWLYPKLREFCHRKHGRIISEYVRNQPHRAFSEFNALGAYAARYHREMFSWQNTITENALREPVAKQFHSWGGITPEIRSEIEQFISGGMSVPINEGQSKGDLHINRIADTRNDFANGDNTPAAEPIPAGIKQLPSGIWVIADDSHVSKWIEQQNRLDHDQNTLPFIIPLIKEGDVVIDAGAFVGDHTIAYLRKVGSRGTVHAFEPNPLAMTCLKHNLATCENGGSNYGLCTYEIALGDKSVDGLPLSGNNLNYGGAYLGDHMPVARVNMMPLDFWNFPKVDFVKLDIEGCEVKALIGMQKTIERCHPKMVIEVNVVALQRQGHTVGQLYALLESHGYEWKIMQENCGEFDPMYDIICSPKLSQSSQTAGSDGKSPEVTAIGNGVTGLTRCTSTPPPVTPFSAVDYLREYALRSPKARWEVMMALYKAGLTPNNKKSKKKRHENNASASPRKDSAPDTEANPSKAGTGRKHQGNTRKLVQAKDQT